MRPYPTPHFPNKEVREASPPGPRIYAGGRRLRVEAMPDGQYRLVDSRGKVHRVGDMTEIEHHIGQQLERGAYKAVR